MSLGGRLGTLRPIRRATPYQPDEASDPLHDPGDEAQVVGITTDRTGDEEATSSQEAEEGAPPFSFAFVGFRLHVSVPIQDFELQPGAPVRCSPAPRHGGHQSTAGSEQRRLLVVGPTNKVGPIHSFMTRLHTNPAS